MIKGLLSDEEIKKQIELELSYYKKATIKYKDIASYNKYNDSTYIKKVDDKYVVVDDEEEIEKFDNIKEVESYIEKTKRSSLRILNSILSKGNEKYMYTRGTIMFKTLNELCKSGNFDKLENIVRKYEKAIKINNNLFKVVDSECVFVGNYLYLITEDGNYDRINIHTLEEEIVENIDYSDFVITKDIK